MWRVLRDLGIECVPMVAFYVVSFWWSFWASTALYVALTAFVIGYLYLTAKRLPYLSIIFGVFVIGSGVATLWFDNPDILIMSDTIYFLLGAGAMAWSLTTPTTLTERLFRYAFDLEPQGWRILTWQWIVIFLIAGVTNDIVRVMMSPEWWIGFQFWRGIAIVLAALLQILVARRYRNPATTTTWGTRL